MKKFFIAFMIISVFACSKNKGDCYWTNGDGDYKDTKPSQQEIDAQELQCSCTVTWYKECP